MYHPQYMITYPMGAFVQDRSVRGNLSNNDRNMKNSMNNFTKITKDEILIELIQIELWLEQNNLINKDMNNRIIEYLNKLDESTQKYNFYITDQSLGSVDRICNISFHSIVNYNLSQNKLQFTAYEKKITWTVIPLFGHIEPYVKKYANQSVGSVDDCIRRGAKQQPVRMIDRRIELNNSKHRARIIKNRKINRNMTSAEEYGNDEYQDQSIWIREIDGILQFGPEETGKVKISELFGVLYFISIVSIQDPTIISVTLHRIK